MKKKVFAMFLAAALLFLVSCSGSTNNSSASAPDPASAGGSPEFVLKIGHDQGESHPYENFAQAFKSYVEEKSNGRIQVDIFNSAVLGSETEMTESLRLGTLDFLVSTTSNSSSLIPEIGILGMPFLYRSTEHALAVCNDPDILAYWQDIVDNSNTNITLLNIAPSGWRNIYATKAIETLDDIKGMNLRCQPAEIETNMWKTLGANPVTMSFGEIYTSFETNLIAAAENCATSYYTNAHYEVAPYFVKTQHTIMIHPIMASTSTMDKLDDDLKQIVYDAAKAGAEALFEAQTQKDEQYLQQAINEQGVTYIDNFDMSPAYDICSSLHTEYARQLGQTEMLNTILSMA
ncbi:TRAP transporter substrate-binding protein [Pseudoflavonifractor sp. 60]|uniref:TRAP transporter substrate-binding protein n=1 Tax=Pseudoflavonifractor sp. 60 TaxID=2304576 RepID=UPI001370D016|nr:TRAP transporter substrate-binding protein [Pseudoflavonifractor sp. 60]NBI67176.1 TRAP transporter substrate-binding protein [Pseudoflavonifractor sp. 60]